MVVRREGVIGGLTSSRPAVPPLIPFPVSDLKKVTWVGAVAVAQTPIFIVSLYLFTALNLTYSLHLIFQRCSKL